METSKRRELILARHKKELFQSDVAKYLGVSTSFYGKIEGGSRRPSLDQIKLLIRLLKINVNML